MSTNGNTKKSCSKCNKGGAIFTCNGCRLVFCLQHVSDHRQELSQQMEIIRQQHDGLKQDINQQSVNKTLLVQIDRWETESIKKIQSFADKARADLKQLTDESKNRLISLMNKLSNELRSCRETDDYTEGDLDRWTKQIEEFRQEIKTSSGIKLFKDGSSLLHLIKVKNNNKNENDKKDSIYEKLFHFQDRSRKVKTPDILSQNNYPIIRKQELSPKIEASSALQLSSYQSIIFGLDLSKDGHLQHLFKYLMSLPPMNKNQLINEKSIRQTNQMEQFLAQTFDFKNISTEYIAPGIKSFRLGKSLQNMDRNSLIRFPHNVENSFKMTVKEILDWQRSYAVYTDKNIKGMTKIYLHRALQGKSEDGKEAFFMKFVVRISTCPVLMEFDGNIIPRNLNENWPHRIKLVSVAGINFAGRKHDIYDILYYVLNWRDIFEVNQSTNQPILCNESDFYRKKDSPLGKLHEDHLLQDLIYMARLRLQACDAEGIQIVVETDIGFGAFSGDYMGTNGKIQITSAIAIRMALEEDGHNYKNIRAIVFALSTFNESRSNHSVSDNFRNFIEEFQEPQYKGPIPVLIVNQDMYRLTVAIARLGFIVSQLNSGDSYGVFGKYWQIQESTMEEKLALTTIGLLVQHHLINPYVLNSDNHHFIELKSPKTLQSEMK